MGTGVAWLDYDQDGLMDLYFVQSGPTDFYKPDHPLRSAHVGRFHLVTVGLGDADPIVGGHVEAGVAAVHGLADRVRRAEIPIHQLAPDGVQAAGLLRRPHQGHHDLPALAQGPDQMPPDEPGSSGDEGPHVASLAITASATSEVPTAVGSSRVGFMS